MSFNKGVFSREKKDDITVNFKLQEKQTESASTFQI